MPVFSRGVNPAAQRDLIRILRASPQQERRLIWAAARSLLDDIRIDPHLKGTPSPMSGYPHMRRLDLAFLRMFFSVRQPPLMDLYVEVVGYSRI